MQQFRVNPIGEVKVDADGMIIQLDRHFIRALKELDGFSHIQVLWWFNGCDNEQSRTVLDMQRPYKKAPAVVGTFATRSPERPNPIALSTAQVTGIDYDQGMIRLAYIDADNGSPVLDLKPYTPSLDRVERPKVPAWCSHWPKNVEQSGAFDWENEFTFR